MVDKLVHANVKCDSGSDGCWYSCDWTVCSNASVFARVGRYHRFAGSLHVDQTGFLLLRDHWRLGVFFPLSVESISLSFFFFFFFFLLFNIRCPFPLQPQWPSGKASTRRVGDLGFKPNFPQSGHASVLGVGTLVAALPSPWCYRVSTKLVDPVSGYCDRMRWQTWSSTAISVWLDK